MSGWIKLEKKLREDIRVKRMAKRIAALLPGLCNGAALHSETLFRTVVLGALATIWMHADTFARADDTLDLGPEEIDDLVGIPNFHTILPPDWFEMLSDDCVKLPNYQSHNGPEAKEKAQTAQRVARHRQGKRNASALQESDGCNGYALPDQTRPDQTRPEERVCVPPAVPRETNLTREEVTDAVVRELLERIKAAYPKGIYRQSDWLLVEREIRALLEEGQEPDAMLAGAERYAAQIRARGCEETEFVMAPLRFFHDRQFFEEFPLPKAEKRGKGPSAEEAEQESLRKLRDRRSAIGLADFREPNPGETADEYRRAQDAEFNARQPRDVHDVAQRLARSKAVA